MNYLIYTKGTSTTGKALIEALREQGCDVTGGVDEPKSKPKTLIRWGSAKNVGGYGKVVNEAKAIMLASNKLQSLDVLKKNKVRVPEVFTDINQIKSGDFPVFGRKIHHIGGNDIILCLQHSDLVEAKQLGCTYFTKYIPTAVEYRMHIFNELSIKASQKILQEKERNKDPWIRNFDEGYIFHAPIIKISKEAREMAKLAVKSLGLNFGAVDIVISDEQKPYILEVNTAPGLQTDNSIEVYVNKLKAEMQ